MNVTFPRMLVANEKNKTSPVLVRQMQTSEWINRAFASLGIDMLVTMAALVLAERMFASGDGAANVTILSPFIVFSLIAWLVSFLLWSVYPDEHRNRLTSLMPRVVLAVISAWIFLVALISIAQVAVPGMFLLSYLVLNLVGVVSWRLISHFVFRSSLTRTKPLRSLIIGPHGLGTQFVKQTEQDSKSLFTVCGVITDDPALVGNTYPVLGSTESNLKSVIEQHQIEAAILVLSNQDNTALEQVCEQLSIFPVQVYAIPKSMEDGHFTFNAASLERFKLSTVMRNTMQMRDRMIKRMIDVTLASIALLLVLPFFSVIAIAIKLNSPGPVFFKQLRVGEYRRRFHMFKFRSMVVNAEKIQAQVNKVDANGHIEHKSEHDPRVTRVGRLIRKTSLDELPQLINVILGDMSLVGPRPEMPWVVGNYEQWQYKRFVVPQGITGWWQINGRKDGKQMNECTEDDLFYIQNYSLLLDVKIILQTIPVVLSGKGSF